MSVVHPIAATLRKGTSPLSTGGGSATTCRRGHGLIFMIQPAPRATDGSKFASGRQRGSEWPLRRCQRPRRMAREVVCGHWGATDSSKTGARPPARSLAFREHARRNRFPISTKSSGNRCGPSLTTHQQRGSIVMAVILSVIYRHFLKAAVFGIVATQGMRR
jgi:hypothetical protein